MVDSSYILPALVVLAVLCGLRARIDVYTAFVRGAKEGLAALLQMDGTLIVARHLHKHRYRALIAFKLCLRGNSLDCHPFSSSSPRKLFAISFILRSR